MSDRAPDRISLDHAPDAWDFIFKLLIVGDSAVGKTSLLLRFCDATFSDVYISTIGVDFKVKTSRVEGKVIKLQIWDSAGQERFRSITSSYYRNTHGILMVYDITDLRSYENIKNWLDEVHRYAKKDVRTMLVGTKSDMANKRAVKEELSKAFAEENAMPFIETSAKANLNVEECFQKIAVVIMNHVVPPAPAPVVNLPAPVPPRSCCGS